MFIASFYQNKFHYWNCCQLCIQLKCRWAHVGLALSILLDIALVSRMNVSLGISDKVMVLFGSAIADAINQFKYADLISVSSVAFLLFIATVVVHR